MFLEYFIEIPLLLFGKRYEFYLMRVDRFVSEGRFDLVKIMYTYGDLRPLPPDRDMQFLLHLHDRSEECVIDLHSEDDRTAEVWPDILHTVIDEHVYVAVIDIILCHTRFDIEECPHAPCKTLHRVEVRPIREEFNGHLVHLTLCIVHIRTDHGYPLKERLSRYFLTEHRT